MVMPMVMVMVMGRLIKLFYDGDCHEDHGDPFTCFLPTYKSSGPRVLRLPDREVSVLDEKTV